MRKTLVATAPINMIWPPSVTRVAACTSCFFSPRRKSIRCIAAGAISIAADIPATSRAVKYTPRWKLVTFSKPLLNGTVSRKAKRICVPFCDTRSSWSRSSKLRSRRSASDSSRANSAPLSAGAGAVLHLATWCRPSLQPVLYRTHGLAQLVVVVASDGRHGTQPASGGAQRQRLGGEHTPHQQAKRQPGRRTGDLVQLRPVDVSLIEDAADVQAVLTDDELRGEQAVGHPGGDRDAAGSEDARPGRRGPQRQKPDGEHHHDGRDERQHAGARSVADDDVVHAHQSMIGPSRRAAKALRRIRTERRMLLPDVGAADGPRDDQALDLRGPLEDRVDLRVAVHPFDGVLAGVAVAAEDLDRLFRHPHRSLTGEELALRALGGVEHLALTCP